MYSTSPSEATTTHTHPGPPHPNRRNPLPENMTTGGYNKLKSDASDKRPVHYKAHYRISLIGRVPAKRKSLGERTRALTALPMNAGSIHHKPGWRRSFIGMVPAKRHSVP